MLSDGCYQIATFQASGTVYRTNKASNTAFRTFGQVQPHLILEEAIEHVAFELTRRTGRRVLPEEIRRKNLYRSAGFDEADSTHFGQPLWFCNLREQWDDLYAESRVRGPAPSAVDEFNRANRWRKRGIAMIPQKYGIGFTQLRGHEHLERPGQRQHGRTARSRSSTAGSRWGRGCTPRSPRWPPSKLNIPLELIRVDRQQHRRDRQRPPHGRLDRLRPQRRRRRAGLPRPAAPARGVLPANEDQLRADRDRRLAHRLARRLAGDRRPGLVGPRQPERRRDSTRPRTTRSRRTTSPTASSSPTSPTRSRSRRSRSTS